MARRSWRFSGFGALPGRCVNTDLVDAAAASAGAICCVAAWLTSWPGQGLVPHDEDAQKSLSFTFQVRPLARLDEARPVERMPPSFAFEHLQLYTPQPVASTLASLQRLV